MPQFLFGLRNVQTNIAIKTSNNKISLENHGYIPLQVNKVSDLINPICLLKSVLGVEDNGNVQPCPSSNTCWLGLYSKHSIKYNDELQKYDLHEIKQFQASLMWTHRIYRLQQHLTAQKQSNFRESRDRVTQNTLSDSVS